MTVWNTIETTLREIFEKRPITSSFQDIHKKVFSLATSSPQFEYDQLRKYLNAQVRAQLKALAELLRGNGGETQLLQRLVGEYDAHSFAILKYSHLFLHLDRHWCPAQRLNGVVALGREIFGTVFLDPSIPIASAISERFLHAVDRERRGEDATSHLLLRSICTMLLEVGHQTTLKTVVIDPFMVRSIAFFEEESSQLLSTLPAPRYIQQYRERVALEAARCGNVFPNYRYTTMVLQAMAQRYLAGPKVYILEQPGAGGMKALVANWQLSDIKIIFGAMSDIGEGKDVVDIVCQHLLTEFANIASPPKVDSAAAAAEKETTAETGGGGGEKKGVPPAAITPARAAAAVMDRCMDLLKKSRELIKTCFVLDSGVGDRNAEAAVGKVTDALINSDDIISEQLAIHHDAVLRSQPTEEELERTCENIGSVFMRLKNKDVFEHTMKEYLARRMLVGSKAQSTEEEHKESILINLLKREVGSAVTSKFEGMFHDKRTSEELVATFHRKLESRGEKLPLELDVVVITSGLWPPLPMIQVSSVPRELMRSVQLFCAFYVGMHKGRRLDFLYSQGSIDIKLNICGMRKKCELNVPTFCLPVLTLFQGDDQYKIKEIAEKAGLTEHEAARAVATLSRSTPHYSGVIVTDTQGLSAASNVKFNTMFKTQVGKIKMVAAVSRAPPASADNKLNADGSKGTAVSVDRSPEHIIEEERKFRIDATVVRLMKARRVMQHTALINETIAMLKKSFLATAKQVKTRCESLLDRDFLMRTDEGDGYIYKA